MPITINDLKFVHSGGAGNIDPLLDLGGIISAHASKQVKSQTPGTPLNITGVVINDAYGNAEGVGTLTFSNSTKFLGWKPFGGVAFTGVNVLSSGTYIIGSSGGYLVVTVTFASLPVSDKSDQITVVNQAQNVFDNVTGAQSLVGKTSYRCLYIQNTNAVDNALDVRVWLKQDTPAGDSLMFGTDPAGKGNGSTTGVAQTIGTEITAPSGVTFAAPTSWDSALQIGTLAPLQSIALWIKRVVPPETRGTVVSNVGQIALSTTT